MDAAYKEHKERYQGKRIDGTWDRRQETIDKFGVAIWFPCEKFSCCRDMDLRDAALKRDPRKMEKHAKSYKHMAAMFDLDWQAFQKFARKKDKQTESNYESAVIGSKTGY